MQSSPPSHSETICFVISTLAIAYVLAAIFHLTGERYGLLIRLLMCAPAMMAFLFAWSFRREPPRAAGFAFTGWKPWVAALLFPLAFEVVAVALAYAIRLVTGQTDFIYLQPANLATSFFGQKLQGLVTLPVIAGRLLLTALIWLLIALAYRGRWPERVKESLPASLRWLHHGFRALLWLPVFYNPYGGRTLSLPGELGEEIGWRGFLVRRWAAWPLTAAAITMPVWALFHLPVPFFEQQRGHYFQNIAFLASIGMFAATMQAFYLWSRSVWPCAVLHLSWNMWNEAILGDVYGWEPGLFGGKFWLFNGEGPMGFLLFGVIAIWLIRRWAKNSKARQRVTHGDAQTEQNLVRT